MTTAYAFSQSFSIHVSIVVFNVYPWNESVITPLHKKGNKSDPDNYRAIAVSSVMGKLFSAILLERLIK